MKAQDYSDRRKLSQAWGNLTRTLHYVEALTIDHDPACSCALCNTVKPALADAGKGMQAFAWRAWARDLSEIISYAGGQLVKGEKP